MVWKAKPDKKEPRPNGYYDDSFFCLFPQKVEDQVVWLERVKRRRKWLNSVETPGHGWWIEEKYELTEELKVKIGLKW